MNNQHYEEATHALADNPGEYEIEKSKALSALALAYEQRTANLIAVQAWLVQAGAVSKDIAGQIDERLDLA